MSIFPPVASILIDPPRGPMTADALMSVASGAYRFRTSEVSLYLTSVMTSIESVARIRAKVGFALWGARRAVVGDSLQAMVAPATSSSASSDRDDDFMSDLLRGTSDE